MEEIIATLKGQREAVLGELARIEAAIAALTGRAAPAGEGSTVKKKRKRRKMTAAERRAVSERMKKSWAARKKKTTRR